MTITPQEILRDDLEIKVALISVYDKTGIVEFARTLIEHGVTVVSTGGTYKALKDAGLVVWQVTDLAPFPEILDGRVKTLQPQIYAGILANKANPEHMATLAKHNIRPIDMVVCNFYPFGAVAANPNATESELIENIDIGGPSQVRAASKNFGSVCVVPSPEFYEDLARELDRNHGKISYASRRMLSGAGFFILAKDTAAVADRLGWNPTKEPSQEKSLSK